MNKVQVWEEKVIIPTYEAGKPDKNPMFLEKRVYQGSSGRIYPHTVIEKISDEKVDKEYTALFLENDYLKVMMLPELGGRIQRAYDKTNGYDFIYYNHVIKPALVGLAGPWISGGIEFNWPQHHRPSTFDQVEYTYAENEDGSATVWMGEIENMFRTEGVLGVTLYPDKAYIELSVKLYNRTKMPQTFLWWANPAVAVNDDTISVFPEVAGPSGVGKSSLVNCLQSGTVMETGSISEKIERGKHTTRHSELISIAQDTYILDTPGFSSLGLFRLEKEQLAEFYPEFAPFEKYCRFGGCSHISEPVCGIKAAVAEGEIPQIRYENYCLLYDELKNQRKY